MRTALRSFFFIGLCITLESRAQRLLTLEEAIAATLSNNYDILIAKNDSTVAAIDYSYRNAALFPRLNGNQWNVPKFHKQLHVAYNIHEWGAHSNIHTGPIENNHIHHSKKPSKFTQKRKKMMDWQIANRLKEINIIKLANFAIIVMNWYEISYSSHRIHY